MLRRFSYLPLVLLAAATAYAPIAQAQAGDEMAVDEGSGEVATPEEAATSVELSDDQAATEAEYGTGDEGRSSTDPFEDPHDEYFFVGAFYRHIIIPQFLLDLFLDESSGADFPGFGAEVTYRKDGFDIVGSLWLARPEGHGPMRASGDPIEDTEWVDSDMWTVFISGTFLWSTAFNDIVALEYGLGIGLGVVIGDVYRWEAYPDSDGNYQRCNGPGDPPGSGRFCGPGPPPQPRGEVQCSAGQEHYGCYEGQWSNGGDVPNVVPWLAIPHLALRIKPIKQLMMRVEGGFGLGFFFGASAAYGF